MSLITETSDRQNFFCGLSGIVLPVPKYKFPEEHRHLSRLAYYSLICNTLEVNATFYKLPLKRTLESWKQQVAPGFRFTFKLPKSLTHQDNFNMDLEEVPVFFSLLGSLHEHVGCVLVQLPPSIGMSFKHQLFELLQAINISNEGRWTIALEFRNQSWYAPEILDWLQENNIIVVRHDMRKAPSPFHVNNDDDHVYLRLHGPEAGYRGSYDDGVLSDYASITDEWLREGKTVYVYFNNTAGDAFANMQRFRQLVASVK